MKPVADPLVKDTQREARLLAHGMLKDGRREAITGVEYWLTPHRLAVTVTKPADWASRGKGRVAIDCH
jgi:hypothetical protein